MKEVGGGGDNLKRALRDVANVLPPAVDAASMAVFIGDLMNEFESCGRKRTGENHKVWFHWFCELVGGVVRRRAERVEEWVMSNLIRFERKGEDGYGLSLIGGESEKDDGMDDEARKFLHTVSVQCRQLQKQWLVRRPYTDFKVRRM